MKKKIVKLFYIIFSLCLIILSLSFVKPANIVLAKNDSPITRQGDTIYFGYYPKTKATDEELSKMSDKADSDGFYTSGKDKFVKVTSANPKVHSETADTNYIPFDDNTQPIAGATYYFKIEPIEWMVLIDDEDNNVVKMVSKYYLDTHAWQTNHDGGKNTAEGVPDNTPANSWRYSEMRAWLNDLFLTTAFNEKERSYIRLVKNQNTIDYKSNDDSTIVNDYVMIGNRSDYDSAGNNGRPTDYTIVKGATWCYNKDHIYYWVNATFPTFGSGYVRLYRHDEHEKVGSVDSVEAVRPIIYVDRTPVKILATSAQKESRTSSLLLIIGISLAVVGGAVAIPIMVMTSAKYKKQMKETNTPYKMTKKEVALMTPGFTALVCGVVLIFLQIFMFGGGFGTKLTPGVYVQQSSFSGGGTAQVGVTAFRINSDGTFDFSSYYQGGSTTWETHGTYTQSNKTITFVYHANPMVEEGHTVTAPIIDSSTFGSANEKYKLVN